MPQYAIPTAPTGTPMNVVQRQDATMIVLRRWLGTMVDWALLWAALYGLGFLWRGHEPPYLFDMWLAAVAVYYVVLEGLWGRTLGKLIVGLVVVGPAGRPPGFVRAAIRTALRLIEVNPLGGAIIAAALVNLTKNHQRLGDMAAQTYVISSSELWRLKPLTPAVAE